MTGRRKENDSPKERKRMTDREKNDRKTEREKERERERERNRENSVFQYSHE